MKQDWLDDIHDRLSDYETESPDGLWEQIESALPESEEKRRPLLLPWRKRLWSGAAAAAAVAVVLTIAGVMRLRPVAQEPEPILAEVLPIAEEPVATPTVAPTQAPAVRPEPVAVAEIETDHTPSHTEDPLPALTLSDSPSGADSAEDTMALAAPQEEEKELPLVLPAENKLFAENADNQIVTKKYRSSLSLSAYASGGLNATSRNSYAAPEGVAATAEIEGTLWADKPLLGVMLYNRGQATEMTLHHYMPIRAGLNLTYQFHERVGIETGLSYACLLSSATEGTDNHYITQSQSLHYIGIPLHLKCRIYSWRGLEIYGSFGGLAEKCVAGDKRTEYVLNNQAQAADTERLTELPYQFSLRLLAGLQYNFVPWAGVYIEPGGAYYFDDGSSLQTIYKQRPLNFHLNMGIRFTLGQQPG